MGKTDTDDEEVEAAQQLLQLSDEENSLVIKTNKTTATTDNGDDEDVCCREITSGKVTEKIFGKFDQVSQIQVDPPLPKRKQKFRSLADIYRVTKPITLQSVPAYPDSLGKKMKHC